MDFAEFVLPNVKLRYEEMEKLVDSWRPQLAAHFPFTALYDGQSTQYLLVEMPFLATAISCAALYGDLPRQIEIAQALIKEIGEHMLLKGEKSLDLLLGILVLIAWYGQMFAQRELNVLTRLGTIGMYFATRRCQIFTTWLRRYW